MRRRSQPVSNQNRSDALEELLAAETQLAQRLDAARAEAAELLKTARENAAVAEANCTATIAARCAQLAAEHDVRLRTELAGIQREAEDLGRRYETVDESRLREYVAFVIARLLGEDDPKDSAR